MLHKIENFESLLINLLAIAPEVILLGGGVMLLLIGLIFQNIKAHQMTLISLLLLLLATISLFLVDKESGTIILRKFDQDLFWYGSILHTGTEIVGLYSRFIILLMAMMAMLHFYYATKYQCKNKKYESPLLILFAVSGMLFAILSNDLITLYLALELSAISLYICIAFDRSTALSTEASLKYFIMSAVASASYLFGSSMIYGATSSLDFSTIAEYNIKNINAVANIVNLSNPLDIRNVEDITKITLSSLFPIGVIMLFVAFAFKLSLSPLHTWAADVYQGASPGVTPFIATISKFTTSLVFIKLFCFTLCNSSTKSTIGSLFHLWDIVFCFALLSITVGTFAALKQTNLLRLIAYSGVVNIGFAFIPFLNYDSTYDNALDTDLAKIIKSSSNPYSNPNSHFSFIALNAMRGINIADTSLLYIIIYSFTTLIFFLIMPQFFKFFNNLSNKDSSTSSNSNQNLNKHSSKINDLWNIKLIAGLGRKKPIASLLLTMVMFSFAGIPPFPGFIAKLLVLSNLLSIGGSIFSFVIALYLVLMTVVGCVYYIRIIKVLYFDTSTK